MELALLIIVLVALIILIYLNLNKRPSSEIVEWLKSTNVRIEGQSKSFNERLDSATHTMSQVQRSLGEMSEIGKGIRTLQDFLQSPKLRGGLGEEVLKEMIGQTFPKNAFHLQYPFKSGMKVDAVLKTDAGLLCIDSKFPMENFKALVNEEPGSKREFISDIKKHIEDISKKYILPDEGTMDFALMYIPSESVYYEVVNIPELSTFARRARVYPVSPNTLYAHLQVLLLSFEGKDLEAKTKEVFRILRAIQNDYSKVEENLSTLQKHLNNAYNMMTNVFSSFNTLGQKISSTQKLGDGVERLDKKGE